MTSLGLYIMNRKGFEALRSLCERHGSASLAWVVTAADKSVREDYCEPIVDYCSQHDIVCTQRGGTPIDLGRADARVAIGWRWIIEDLRQLYVLHDSPLPRYRGFAPLVNMLVNGERELAVTAIQATEGYDEGPVVLQESVGIEYPIKIRDAIESISRLYGRVLLKLYSALDEDALEPCEQVDGEASYSVWLDDADYYVDWSWPAEKIERFVDAVGFPYRGARTRLDGQDVMLEDVRAAADRRIVDRERHIGKVIAFDEGRPLVICGAGLARIESMAIGDRPDAAVPLRSRFA